MAEDVGTELFVWVLKPGGCAVCQNARQRHTNPLCRRSYSVSVLISELAGWTIRIHRPPLVVFGLCCLRVCMLDWTAGLIRCGARHLIPHSSANLLGVLLAQAAPDITLSRATLGGQIANITIGAFLLALGLAGAGLSILRWKSKDQVLVYFGAFCGLYGIRGSLAPRDEKADCERPQERVACSRGVLCELCCRKDRPC